MKAIRKTFNPETEHLLVISRVRDTSNISAWVKEQLDLGDTASTLKLVTIEEINLIDPEHDHVLGRIVFDAHGNPSLEQVERTIK
ncbi:MAG: hypothetical protein HQ556_13555 [Candidatus Marinimicrobia bacterium]|nr:hypothetical protein [Candidatus Neomarinimicrobiota bacterium]